MCRKENDYRKNEWVVIVHVEGACLTLKGRMYGQTHHVFCVNVGALPPHPRFSFFIIPCCPYSTSSLGRSPPDPPFTSIPTANTTPHHWGVPPRPSHWPGDRLQGIVSFAAVAALRPRPLSSRWSGDVLQGAMPFAAVAALRCAAGGHALRRSRRAAASALPLAG